MKKPRRCYWSRIKINIGGEQIETTDRLKYLGVQFDKNMRMVAHVENTAKKTQKLTTALERIMPNHGGPGTMKRRIQMMAINSIMLYVAPICKRL